MPAFSANLVKKRNFAANEEIKLVVIVWISE
jgi:hypothetical protein